MRVKRSGLYRIISRQISDGRQKHCNPQRAAPGRLGGATPSGGVDIVPAIKERSANSEPFAANLRAMLREMPLSDRQ